MQANFPTLQVPATPEYVLSVIRDEHRRACDSHEADPEAVITFDTTVKEWLDAMLDEDDGNLPFGRWKRVGNAMNHAWNIQCSHEEWRAALKPLHEKRLGDMCALIAKYGRRPQIRPARLFGATCLPAGEFLTIRSLLAEAGADADEIRPSTPLAPYARRYLEVFLDSILRLAPGALPPVQILYPTSVLALWGMGMGALLCLVGLVVAVLWPVCCFGLILLLVSGIIQWNVTGDLPKRVAFGELRTFRDLAVVVTEGNAGYFTSPLKESN
jgi:hypothetical protein